MRLIPLKQWICDSCGEVIEKPKDGWFEWYSDTRTHLETGFRIVHSRESCMYDDRTLREQHRSPLDQQLPVVLGSSGLGYLLFMLELTEKKKVVRKIASVSEFVEMIRRLHLPYWEEARLYWKDAYREGLHDACSFDEKTLITIIEEYERGQSSD